MKHFAVMVDISPSEQLNENPDALKAMGLVFGRTDRNSLDFVGSRFYQDEHKFHLKKWSSSNGRYKLGFIEHAKVLMNSGNLFFGSNVVNNRIIKDIGVKYWELYMGKIPTASSFNKKNRPRVKIGNYQVDGITIPEYEILVDDLIIIGWYGEALVNYLKKLIQINEATVKLEVLIDRLPNEQGGDLYHKVTLLKELSSRASANLLDIVGIPKNPDTLQRDLLADNIAGLLYDINADINSPYKEANSLFKFNRKTS
jgi:hypothetical protein